MRLARYRYKYSAHKKHRAKCTVFFSLAACRGCCESMMSESTTRPDMATRGTKLTAVFLNHGMVAAFWARLACHRCDFLDGFAKQVALLWHHDAHVFDGVAVVAENAEHGVAVYHQTRHVGDGGWPAL